jgi:UDP-3-O-[3-hydroxymyristoyl] glucosamine N-acyltransferase
MVTLDQIISVLEPTKTIINCQTTINNPIQLVVDNERDNVVMWSSSKLYSTMILVTKGTIICANIETSDVKNTCNYIVVENPRNAFRLVLEKFFTPKTIYAISKTAIIHPSVFLSKNVSIGENVVIEENCSIGEFSRIGHNTTILANTIIRNKVTIGSNTVIGSVGFGYEKDENGAYVFIPHIGNVIIEDNVEIGNCTTIDRAVMGSTILRANVKVDNLVHIAHGVDIGENSLIIANSMIGGSTIIGRNVWVAPSSCLINKIKIGDDAIIGLGAVVVKSVEKGTVVVGNPARPLEKR